MNNYEIANIARDYYSRVFDSQKQLRLALETADRLKALNNWAGYAEFLQIAANEANELAQHKAAAAAFDAKHGI
jgi:hypothetical protein